MAYSTQDVTEIKDGKTVALNRYWLCKDGDPTKAIFFDGVAQCNRNKRIPNRMKAFIKERTGWDVDVVFLEIAYRHNT